MSEPPENEIAAEIAAAIAEAKALSREDGVTAALDRLRPLVERAPEDPTLLFAFATHLRDAGLWEQAVEALATVVRLRPGSVEAGASLAHCLVELGRFNKAMTLARSVSDKGFGIAAVGRSAADVYNRLGYHRAARPLYRRTLVYHPDHARGYANLSEAIYRAGNRNRSLALLRRARVIDPTDPSIRLNLAFALHAAGRTRRGWAAYEARLDPGIPEAPRRTHLALPRWTGEALDGPLLVCSEQGLGDEIRFAGALKALTARGIAPVVECDARLTGMIARSVPGATAHPFKRRRDGLRAVFDYRWLDTLSVPPVAYIEAGSLPHLIGPLPLPQGPVLHPAPDRVAALREALRDRSLTRPRIGLVWGSTVSNPARARFYPSLQAMKPILSLPDVDLVNLQYVDASADLARIAEIAGVTVHDTPEVDKRHDLEGAAALAATCDLVIGVSSSVTAMSAAVGTWTLELVPEPTWAPRFPSPAGDMHDCALPAMVRIEAELSPRDPDDPAGRRAWAQVMARAAETTRRFLNLE